MRSFHMKNTVSRIPRMSYRLYQNDKSYLRLCFIVSAGGLTAPNGKDSPLNRSGQTRAAVDLRLTELNCHRREPVR